MGIFDWIKQKQDEKRKVKEADEELRRQVEEEVLDEVITIKKEKLKQQILSEARGEKKPEGKGSKLLKQLGDEFKQSNIGGNDQMDKLLGKRNSNINNNTDNFSTNKLMNSIGGQNKSVNISGISGKIINTQQNYAETLGGHGPTSEKLKMMAGVKDNTENLKKMSRLKKNE